MQAKERKPSYFTGHGLGYRFRDAGDHLLYEFDGEVEEVKVRQVTLEALGLRRQPDGRIIRK